MHNHARKHLLFAAPRDLLHHRDPTAYVLLFNPGRINEGIYTLQGLKDKHDQNTFLLVFEEMQAAQRFSTQLHADNFEHASPTEWSVDTILDFCDSTGFQLAFVPDGALFFPPSSNRWDSEAFDECANEAVLRRPVECGEKFERARLQLERLWNQDN